MGVEQSSRMPSTPAIESRAAACICSAEMAPTAWFFEGYPAYFVKRQFLSGE
jgi:hypothetical protein